MTLLLTVALLSSVAISQALESCADLTGDTPEDLAWNLFRCGYNKKAVLFNNMSSTEDGQTELESNFK